jgi:hypothetical protein
MNDIAARQIKLRLLGSGMAVIIKSGRLEGAVAERELKR